MTRAQTACLALVRDYLAHNISVGGTDIDSLWSTGVNDFAWDTAKFPNATAMVSEMHTLGVRVVLWATSLIDTDSPNFAVAKAKGYLVSKGRTVPWWHGHGAFIDYTYAPALQWWNSLLDGPLVTTGVDGFKVGRAVALELDAHRAGSRPTARTPICWSLTRLVEPRATTARCVVVCCRP